MPYWIPLLVALVAAEPTELPESAPEPVTEKSSAPSTNTSPATDAAPSKESVDLRPVYKAGDTMKIRWTTDNVDVREGERIGKNQKRSTSHCELTFTLKIEEVFPDRVYRCSAKMDRVVIEAPTMGGVERYDSADPKTAESVFSSPARILLMKPLEFAISGETMSFYRKEHPRLRAWYADGANLLDNTFGDNAFPARFGVLFGWRADSATVGQKWKDTVPVQINSGYPIITEREFTLLDNDGITMNIGIDGKGLAAPDSGQRSQIFKESTYEGKYKVNTASAKIREGEITHTYSADYNWQGSPATVTSTVKEKIERLE
ncbi:MAG: hypothetical protein KF691_03320 [Phycisphaeraceae bacterium]|nr:hypothetical protein [Phycisphaeraceae bacterium]